jgi:hypothetical protein
MSDRLIGLLLMVISGLFYVQTLFFKKPPFAAFQEMGADFFPRGIVIALAICGLALLVKGQGSLLPSWRLGSMRAGLGKYRDVLITLLLFPLYLVGVGLIGFTYSTVIYLVVMQLALYPRKGISLAYVVVGSAAFTWGAVLLFQNYLHVVFPSGSLF